MYNLLYFFYFCGSFLPSWVRIRIANPDPDPETIECGSNPDPDPHHWLLPVIHTLPLLIYSALLIRMVIMF